MKQMNVFCNDDLHLLTFNERYEKFVVFYEKVGNEISNFTYN